jgi:hypothetical protein
MTISRRAALRPAGAASLLLAASLTFTACTSADDVDPTPTATPTELAGTPTPDPTPSPTPTPTPEPTPRFTNAPDEELTGLFPEAVAGAPLVVPPLDAYALTPGDFGSAYGEIGNRFASLALAYIERPRLSLYAARVDGAPVRTEDLEPHLATAGRYVGIAGLHREPWELVDVDGTLAWARPEDNATAAGTIIYTWSSGEFVFLLIGVDDATNRALVSALPGEPAPTPTPEPTPTGSPSPGATDGDDAGGG